MARIPRVHHPRRSSLIVAAAVLVAAVAAASAGAVSRATPPSNTSAPTISGPPERHATLNASAGSWNGTTPISYAYQWLRCNDSGSSCKSIGHAKSASYEVSGNDVGNTLRVQVTATNSAGSGQATSAQTAKVSAGNPPKNTTPPAISGMALQGNVLTASPGSWTGSTPISYSYRWRRCGPGGGNCNSIDGASNSTYKLTSDDVALTVRVRVTASNSAGSNDANSNATARIDGPPALEKRPSVSGNPTIGSHLSAGNGAWRSISKITYAYQWYRCDTSGNNCVEIAGAASPTYTVTPADSGHTLTFVVRATNAKGTTTAEARPSGVVGGTVPPPAGAIPITQVSSPDRLIVDKLTWSPSFIHSRSQALVGRFHVSETLHGKSVAGAVVYALGVPFGWLSNAPEAVTDGSGWATVTFSILPGLPLKHGTYVVVFVRARKPGENLLAGVSTRRLVSVQVR
jgi:hypothetical protein